ncbi:MAG: NADH-quinone oxidoreductase subunit L [Candidatus Goldiibacteriota bacterium]
MDELQGILGLIITGIPLLAFVLIVLFAMKNEKLSALISIAGAGTALAVSLYILFLQINMGGQGSINSSIPWMYLGDLKLHIGVMMNPLTAVMLIVVTGVSFLVQIYSMGYMKGDRAYSKFFAYLSLFSFSMLGIVIANNLLQLFIFWELVGLSSYLLIGFWYHKPEAAAAGKKAFVVTRFGDFGFLIGILMLTYITGTFDFAAIEAMVKANKIETFTLTVIMVLLFCGAAGKSAQFPLHVWLPDAMEGPTPVSALIHAATMVAAGVFMVARLFGLFMSAPESLIIIAYIGGFTALFAATIAIVQNDIKRVLAFSTLSQLGFMMLALGVGGYTAGMFHLFTHAFFKALLFLGAGSVIHSVHTNNIQQMGGLHRKMPVTSITFLIAAFAIAGIPPFAGFWSKDEIMAVIMDSGHAKLYYAAAFTAFLTAFYMFRLYFLAFMGKPRDREVYDRAHESPLVMTVPLMILAVMSVFGGFWGAPAGTPFLPEMKNSIYAFLYYGSMPHIPHFHMNVALISSGIAVSGILLAVVMYWKKIIDPEKIRKMSGPVYTLLYNKYFIDELYMFIIRNVLFRLSLAVKWFDRHVVDGLVNLSAFACRWGGAKLRKTVTGSLQNYALAAFGGFVVIVAALAIYNPEALRILGGK